MAVVLVAPALAVPAWVSKADANVARLGCGRSSTMGRHRKAETSLSKEKVSAFFYWMERLLGGFHAMFSFFAHWQVVEE